MVQIAVRAVAPTAFVFDAQARFFILLQNPRPNANICPEICYQFFDQLDSPTGGGIAARSVSLLQSLVGRPLIPGCSRWAVAEPNAPTTIKN
jgi:hypothetical protein